MGVVCSVLRRLAVYAPGALVKQAEAELRASAVQLVADAARAGEHYVHNRATEVHTPPDGDRAPRQRAPWDDDRTPTVTAQERVRGRR